jgi:hypothetical protein
VTSCKSVTCMPEIGEARRVELPMQVRRGRGWLSAAIRASNVRIALLASCSSLVVLQQTLHNELLIMVSDTCRCPAVVILACHAQTEVISTIQQQFECDSPKDRTHMNQFATASQQTPCNKLSLGVSDAFGAFRCSYYSLS